MASPSRKIAKLLCAAALAAGTVFAPSGGAFASPIANNRAPGPLKSTSEQSGAASGTRSEFENEQAMSAAQLIDRWAPFIKEASRRFGISEDWIRAVMRLESGGRTLLDDQRPMTSNAGAMGIMQVMPDTYEDMRQQYRLGANPYNPRDNVLAGTAYLRRLYGKYGYPRMFAAYNAGPGTLEAHIAGARRLPDETRDYVSAIARILGAGSYSLQSTKVLATLTRPDGSPLSIDGAAVDSIRASLPDEYAPGVQTVVAMGNLRQGVREDLATVASAIRRSGGKV